MKQRLALFLDGTWNTEDDSTNVLHAFTLMQEGIIKDRKTNTEIEQKRYYDQGVGTGILDSVLGGAFGIGLEGNVREAYNWLLDHYNDGDEIYIFGFSRGAYTARSLMGFIANCGLVHRGSPLTVSQLWEGNRLIELERNKDIKIDKSKLKFRRISSICENPENLTEELLIRWSRRVDITYMGIFDTVSALGLDALGIPGISSKMALDQNKNASGILQNCRHALAIDENRNSFRLTPIRHFMSKNAYDGSLNPFEDKVIQRWFIGSHSNIGGSYPDNLLAKSPLLWIMFGALKQGLQFEKESGEGGQGFYKFTMLPSPSDIRDSHADFGIFWNDILRAKRHYRPIAQPDEVTAEHTWRAINEKIHPSVFKIIQKAEEDGKTYAPPNLLAYLDSLPELKEKEKEAISNTEETSTKDIPFDYKLKEYYEQPKIKEKTDILTHNWLQRTTWSAALFIVWITLSVIGLDYWLGYFLGDMITLNHWSKAILASVFVLVDWTESLSNWRSARFPKKILPKVIRAVMRLVSLIGVMSFFTGVVYFSYQIWDYGIGHPFDFNSLVTPLYPWFFIPTAAGITMFMVALLEKFITQKSSDILFAVVKGIIIFGILSTAILLVSKLINHLSGAPSEHIDIIEATAGKFLFIALLSALFYSALKWVGKPMNEQSKIGSITALQWVFTPMQVAATFELWKDNLTYNWTVGNKSDAEVKAEVRAVIEETLWRDMLGFIPIFTVIFGFILWIGDHHGLFENWTYLTDLNLPLGMPFWLLLIIILAVADYFEDIIYMTHLKNYMSSKNISGIWAITGFLANVIKFTGFTISILLCLFIVSQLTYEVVTETGGGWKWTISICIIIFLAISFLSSIINWSKQKLGMT